MSARVAHWETGQPPILQKSNLEAAGNISLSPLYYDYVPLQVYIPKYLSIEDP